MSLTVQSSFTTTEQDITNKNINTMITSGDAIYNNFVYGVEQKVDKFNVCIAKTCLRNGYTASTLAGVLGNLLSGQTAPTLPLQENTYINNTSITEDVWDSIDW